MGDPAPAATRSRMSSKPKVPGSPESPKSLSGSPSSSIRMFARTLSSGCVAIPATSPSTSAASSSSRLQGRGVHRSSSGGRRRTCASITSMDAERTGAGMQLKRAVVVVTGASAGIGEATAVAFARRGARVVLAARRLPRLQETAERIKRAGGQALGVACDVTEPHDLRTLRAATEEEFGPTDGLVNNAGIPGGGPFVSLDDEAIRRVVDVNLMGVLFGTRTFLPGMMARGHGHVVNVASL